MHTLDRLLLRRACDRIAATYDAADFFCAEVRQRLLECLGYMALKPERILDLGSGTGAAGVELARLYPAALIIGLDWSEAMLRQASGKQSAAPLCADGHRLPLATGSIDIVVSNLLLPGAADPQQIFTEVHRVLRNPGLFLFTTLGPDSLAELRQAWAAIDSYPHVHEFADMHNVGDALVRAGFSDPVMDTETITINYGGLDRLVADLRAVAATNISSARRRGLTPPLLWQQFAATLEAGRTAAGKLPARLEVVTGQAWVAAPGIGVPMEDGEARFPVSRLRY
jgi:malonyl-CoA O-methyltransferase